MKLFLIVTSAPTWANGNKQPLSGFPLDPVDYAAFITAAAKRYPTVKLWQVWGEPSVHTHFDEITPETPGKPLSPSNRAAVTKYAVLLDGAYQALKSVDPANTVIGGNTYAYSDIRPLTWVKYLKLPDGKPPRMDLYGHNPFSYRRPDLRNPPSGKGIVQIDDLPQLQKSINRYLAKPLGSSVGLWLGEYLLPTRRDDFYFDFWISQRAQASWLKRALAIARKLPSVKGFAYAQLKDDPQHSVFSGLLNADGTPKPGYFAFKRG